VASHNRKDVGERCDGGETEVVTIEVGEQTAEQLTELAWEYGTDRRGLIQKLCETAAERSRH
jgi:hypothetical protein